MSESFGDGFGALPSKVIPPAAQIGLAPDERARRRRNRIIAAVLLLIAIAISSWLVFRASQRANQNSLVQIALDSGTLATTLRALAALERESDDDSVAKRAYLHALARFWGAAQSAMQGDNDFRWASCSGAAQDLEGDALSFYVGARILNCMSTQHVDVALTTAGSLPSTGAFSREAAYLRTLLAVTVGDEQGKSAGRAALLTEPTSQRFRVLAALTSGDESDLGSDQGPQALWVRLRHVFAEFANLPAIRSSSAGFDQAARAELWPAQLHWLQLIEARALFEAGDQQVAESIFQQHSGPLDEVYELERIDLAARLKRFVWADEVGALLPSGFSANATRRAEVLSELLLGKGRTEEALALVTSAATPRARLVRALSALSLATGGTPQPSVNIEAELTELTQHGLVGLRASLGLVQEFIRTRQAPRAVQYSEALLARFPTDPWVALATATASGAAGNFARAVEVLRPALAAYPNNAEMRASFGRFLGRMEPTPERLLEASAALGQAAGLLTGDAQLHLDWGLALIASGQKEAALSPLEQVTTLAAGGELEVIARLRRADLSIELGNLAVAEAELTRLDQLAQNRQDIEETRARFLVASLRGEAAIAGVRTAMRRFRRSISLQESFIELLTQAERWEEVDQNVLQGIRGELSTAAWRMRRVLAIGKLGRESQLQAVTRALLSDREAPLSRSERAILWAAQGWAELAGEQLARARGFARRAMQADPENVEGQVLSAALGVIEGTPDVERIRSLVARGRSVEAIGMMAAVTPDAAAACELGARYLSAAPRGRLAADVRTRCP